MLCRLRRSRIIANDSFFSFAVLINFLQFSALNLPTVYTLFLSAPLPRNTVSVKFMKAANIKKDTVPNSAGEHISFIRISRVHRPINVIQSSK